MIHIPAKVTRMRYLKYRKAWKKARWRKKRERQWKRSVRRWEQKHGKLS